MIKNPAPICPYRLLAGKQVGQNQIHTIATNGVYFIISTPLGKFGHDERLFKLAHRFAQMTC